jgi:hypothetical protein
MSPTTMKRPAYRYSICGFSMIGAAIRYAEIVNTTTGMMIGTCNKQGKGVLYTTDVTLGYVIILRLISSLTKIFSNEYSRFLRRGAVVAPVFPHVPKDCSHCGFFLTSVTRKVASVV